MRWIFWPQNTKEKIRQKIRQPKTKKPPAHDPPEIRQPGPKIRRKIYQQIRLSNLQVHAGFVSIEKACSWRRLQSMISGTLFGCLLGMVEAPMLKCSCNPSAAAGGMDKVCCAPFQTTLLVKSVRFEENGPKKSPRDSATSGSPTQKTVHDEHFLGHSKFRSLAFFLPLVEISPFVTELFLSGIASV